jgi:hypothetical protein
VSRIPFHTAADSCFRSLKVVKLNTCCRSLSVGCVQLSVDFGLWKMTVASHVNLCAEQSLMVRAIKVAGCSICTEVPSLFSVYI